MSNNNDISANTITLDVNSYEGQCYLGSGFWEGDSGIHPTYQMQYGTPCCGPNESCSECSDRHGDSWDVSQDHLYHNDVKTETRKVESKSRPLKDPDKLFPD